MGSGSSKGVTGEENNTPASPADMKKKQSVHMVEKEIQRVASILKSETSQTSLSSPTNRQRVVGEHNLDDAVVVESFHEENRSQAEEPAEGNDKEAAQEQQQTETQAQAPGVDAEHTASPTQPNSSDSSSPALVAQEQGSQQPVTGANSAPAEAAQEQMPSSE